MRNKIIAGLLVTALVVACAKTPPPEVKTVEAIPDRNKEQGNLLDLMYGKEVREKADVSAILANPLGSEENPVRADMPAGQRRYLNRLRCRDGKRPTYFRKGSYGSGPWGSIIDGYEVSCKEGITAMIYMDMYHPGYEETKAVKGFYLRPL